MVYAVGEGNLCCPPGPQGKADAECSSNRHAEDTHSQQAGPVLHSLCGPLRFSFIPPAVLCETRYYHFPFTAEQSRGLGRVTNLGDWQPEGE